MKNTTWLVVCSLVLTFCAVGAFAQSDTLKVDYFANANSSAPDGTMRLSNPGTYVNTAGKSLNICASIFVFAPDQELSECCSCLLTPDGLRTLSINTDVTGNPLTGVKLNSGLIKVVSTKPSAAGTCPLPTTVVPVAAIRSWVTHIQDNSLGVTVTGSQDATLSQTEIKSLQQQCFGVKLVGSGKGVCTCGTGE